LAAIHPWCPTDANGERRGASREDRKPLDLTPIRNHLKLLFEAAV
jgi:hypothetical protein